MGLEDEVKQRLEKKTPLDILVEVNEKKEKIDNAFRKGFNNFIKTLPLILINLFSAFIIGVDNFVKGKWDWSIFSEASFWYSYISYQTANWLVAITWLVVVIKKLKNTTKKYLENLDFIQLMVDEDYKDEFIERQVDIEKLRRKKNTLERKVYSQMYKLRVKHKIDSIEDFLKLDKQTIKGWRKKRIHTKLEWLNEMLSIEWQKKYLKSYKIKYIDVTRSKLVSGFHVRKREGDYNDYKSRLVWTSFKALAPSAVTSSVIALVLLSFQFLFKEANIYTWLKFAIQILLIIWNTSMVVATAPTIFSSTLQNSVEQRRSDLGLMKKRHEANNENEKDLVLILDYNEKSVA